MLLNQFLLLSAVLFGIGVWVFAGQTTCRHVWSATASVCC